MLQAFRVLAAAAGQSGVPRRGVALLQKVVALQPRFADGHIQLAKLLRLDGQGLQAVAALRRPAILALAPGSAAAYNDLGLAPSPRRSMYAEAYKR